jgi:hypothetical protein
MAGGDREAAGDAMSGERPVSRDLYVTVVIPNVLAVMDGGTLEDAVEGAIDSVLDALVNDGEVLEVHFDVREEPDGLVVHRRERELALTPEGLARWRGMFATSLDGLVMPHETGEDMVGGSDAS